ncbi:hypothetical protein SK128_015639, partial [Halocaridina rubra]
GFQITIIPDLRWRLFCKQLAKSNRLPPTLGVLEEHIKSMRLQTWAIFHLVQCLCKSNCSTQRCSSKRNDLLCSELSLCDLECTDDEDYDIGRDGSDDLENDL